MFALAVSALMKSPPLDSRPADPVCDDEYPGD
jgi:hypothetical protein